MRLVTLLEAFSQACMTVKSVTDGTYVVFFTTTPSQKNTHN